MNIYIQSLKAQEAFLLARVSSEEQKKQGNSLPAQIERLQNYIQKQEGLKLKETYMFDESASKEDRKKFEAFLNRIVKSRKTIAIISDKVDRLLRDFPTWLPKLDKLRKSGLVELHFASDQLIVHQQSNAIELFQFNMAVALAQYFTDSISDSTKRGLEGKILKGEWPTGNIPRGYIAKKDIVRDRLRTVDIIPKKGEAQIVQQLFRKYATGLYSLYQLAEWSYAKNLRTRNNKKPSLNLISRILQNPFYYGQMRFREKLFPHKYQPLVAKSLFDEVQKVLSYKTSSKTKNRQKVLKLFQAIMRCAHCGCAITAESKKEGKYILYSCTNHFKNCERIYVNEKILIEQVMQIFESIELSDEQIHYVVNELKKEHESHRKFHNDILVKLNHELGEVEKHIGSLFDKYTMPNSLITDEMYTTKLNQLNEQKHSIQEELNAFCKNEKDHISIKSILKMSQRTRELFLKSDIEKQRLLLNFVFSNLSLDGKKLCYTMRFPFKELENRSSPYELGQFCNTFRKQRHKLASIIKKMEVFGLDNLN